MERYAIDASGLYVKLRRSSDASPYNSAPVITGHDGNQARLALLTMAGRHYPPLPSPDSDSDRTARCPRPPRWGRPPAAGSWWSLSRPSCWVSATTVFSCFWFSPRPAGPARRRARPAGVRLPVDQDVAGRQHGHAPHLAVALFRVGQHAPTLATSNGLVGSRPACSARRPTRGTSRPGPPAAAPSRRPRSGRTSCPWRRPVIGGQRADHSACGTTGPVLRPA